MTEWQRGWRVVLGSALAAGTGINLLYNVSSIFLPQLQEETGWTLGQFSQVTALVGVGSLLAAPAVGWIMDRFGFRRIYALGMILIASIYIAIAVMPLVPVLYGFFVFMVGLIGLMTSSIAYTRAVNGWFAVSRGFALSVAATGLSLSATVFPPVFEWLASAYGWRAGYLALAALALLVGLPAVLFLVKESPAKPAENVARPQEEDDGSHFGTSTFWLLVVVIVCLNLPGSGMLSQMVPMMLEEGIESNMAAWGISAFAIGQVAGRLGCGWLLDRTNPVRVGFFFTLIPALGCFFLSQTQGSVMIALAGVAAVGVQQGAEIDLLGFFVARRYGLTRYGSIYGWIQSAGWAGTIGGILMFGLIHDLTGSYALFQLGAVFAYLIGAFAILAIRLPQKGLLSG
jgi:MFS family permease